MARLGASACAAVVALSVVEATQAADRLVPSQYATIQAAINAASAGDQVVVSPGTYVGQISMSGKAITLRSTGGSAVTALSPGSAGGAVVYCTSAETSACIIQGFTITGATNGPGVAIVTASPVFKFCEIKQNLNSSSSGAGVNITGTTGTPRFEDCFIFGNYANARQGGGLSCTLSGSGASLTCVRCTFQQNEVVNESYGGAVHIAGTHSSFQAAFTDCVFRLNTITASDGNRYGGAIFSTAPLMLTGCTFDRNSVLQSVGSVGGDVHSRGGAVYSSNSVSATDCTFLQNVARSTPNLYCCGGASYARGGAFYLDSAAAASFLRCSFTQNSALQPLSSCSGARAAQGGALYCGGGVDPVITTCSFTGNRAELCSGGQGGAIAYDIGSEGSITNSTFSACYAGGAGGALQIFGGAGPLVMGCTFSNCTTPNTGSGGAVKLDAGGVLSTFRDCRFTNCSAGFGGAVWVTNTRPTFDHCVFDHNAAPSGSAILSGGTGILNVPIVCYSNFCSNSGASSNWISPATAFTDAHATGPTNHLVADCGVDCNANGILDSDEIDAGLPDCDGDDIPDTCEPDCDGDGVPNACEITDGAPDCDSNGVPDACEVAAGDVNRDGIPDACQPSLEFSGIVTEIVPIVGAGSGVPGTAVCWRVYATFSNPNATLATMYGIGDDPLLINATGGFWQSSAVGAGDLPLGIPCSAPSPALLYDSYLTIGASCNDGTPLAHFGIDFSQFAAGTIATTGATEGGAVYATSNGVSASPDGRILLMQLTTVTGVKPTGQFNLVGESSPKAGGGEWRAYQLTIPEPALVDCNGNGQHDAIEIAQGLQTDCDFNGVPDSCQSASAGLDCDGDGTSDFCELASGSFDSNNNGKPDQCDCVGDANDDGAVNVEDLIEVIVSWGDLVVGGPNVDGVGLVDNGDLVLVLNNWGSCVPLPPPGAG